MIIYKHDLVVKYHLTQLKLGVPENYRKKCINEIYNLGDSMEKTTNIQGIMTSYRIYEESKVFDKLLSNIVRIIRKTKDTMFKNQWDLTLLDAWGGIYKKNHYTLPHTHMPAVLSFVYYLQATPKTPIIFPDNDFVLHPKTDTLVIFPSFALHEVPMHKDKEDRVIIAGNMVH